MVISERECLKRMLLAILTQNFNQHLDPIRDAVVGQDGKPLPDDTNTTISNSIYALSTCFIVVGLVMGFLLGWAVMR